MIRDQGKRDRDLRVLLLASAASTHTTRWANALVARGMEVHLLSLHPGQESLDFRVHVYRAPIGVRTGYVLNAPWARKTIRSLRPDLVHAHYASGYGTLAALCGYRPTILSVWGSDVYEFPGRSPVHRWMIRSNLRKADRILSTSHAMARQAGRFTSKEIAITPFGVDTSLFRPRDRRPAQSECIVIGTVRALDRRYGIDYLLRGFRLLRERLRENLRDRLPDIHLKLLIVGGGPSASELRRLAVELDIAGDTRFTGPVPHSQVPEYLRELDIYVAPSVCEESFGVAVIEASATGIPVVVSDVGGLPEVVEHGVTGVVVEARSETQVANALERLVLDPDLRLRMGAAGRHRVQRLYEWKDTVERMLSVYREVTGSLAEPAPMQRPLGRSAS